LNCLVQDYLPQGPASGQLKIKGFRIIKAPTMASLLSLASLVGTIEMLNGPGISFNKLETKLSWQDKIFTIEDAKMPGNSLALTAGGYFDLNKEQLDLKGKVIPFNIINSIVKSVPLVGSLLVGDGIIATDYHMQGAMDDPKIAVNPVSTLLPGFFAQSIWFRRDTKT